MANRSLNIEIKVSSASSSQRLSDVQKKLRKTGQAAKKVSTDFTQFNRVLFAATAYVSIFTRAFSAMGRVIEEGAGLARLEDQFESTFHISRGTLAKYIRGFSKTYIEQAEAMRSAVAIRQMGINLTTKQIAEGIALAGYAAKKAGKDAAAGVREFTGFMKDHSETHFQFFNMVSKGDPIWRARMAQIKSHSGAMAPATLAIQKYALFMEFLRKKTKGAKDDTGDLLDSIKALKDAFFWLKLGIGQTLGESIKPIIEGVTTLARTFDTILTSLRDNSEFFKKLTSSIVMATAAMGGLLLVFGGFRFIVFGLNKLGFGLPALLSSVGLLTAIFSKWGVNIDSVKSSLETFANIIHGAYQIVSSFFSNPDFRKRGVGALDPALWEKLTESQRKWMMLLARVSAFLGITVGGGIKMVVSWVHKLMDVLGGISSWLTGHNVISDMFSNFDPDGGLSKTIKAVVAGFLTLEGLRFIGITKFLGRILPFLKHIPVFGKRYFGGEGGRLGTKLRPMWVKIVDYFQGVTGGSSRSGGKVIGGTFGSRLLEMLGITAMVGKYKGLKLAAAGVGAKAMMATAALFTLKLALAGIITWLGLKALRLAAGFGDEKKGQSRLENLFEYGTPLGWLLKGGLTAYETLKAHKNIKVTQPWKDKQKETKSVPGAMPTATMPAPANYVENTSLQNEVGSVISPKVDSQQQMINMIRGWIPQITPNQSQPLTKEEIADGVYIGNKKVKDESTMSIPTGPRDN